MTCSLFSHFNFSFNTLSHPSLSTAISPNQEPSILSFKTEFALQQTFTLHHLCPVLSDTTASTMATTHRDPDFDNENNADVDTTTTVAAACIDNNIDPRFYRETHGAITTGDGIPGPNAQVDTTVPITTTNTSSTTTTAAAGPCISKNIDPRFYRGSHGSITADAVIPASTEQVDHSPTSEITRATSVQRFNDQANDDLDFDADQEVDTDDEDDNTSTTVNTNDGGEDRTIKSGPTYRQSVYPYYTTIPPPPPQLPSMSPLPPFPPVSPPVVMQQPSYVPAAPTLTTVPAPLPPPPLLHHQSELPSSLGSSAMEEEETHGVKTSVMTSGLFQVSPPPPVSKQQEHSTATTTNAGMPLPEPPQQTLPEMKDQAQEIPGHVQMEQKQTGEDLEEEQKRSHAEDHEMPSPPPPPPTSSQVVQERANEQEEKLDRGGHNQELIKNAFITKEEQPPPPPPMQSDALPPTSFGPPPLPPSQQPTQPPTPVLPLPVPSNKGATTQYNQPQQHHDLHRLANPQTYTPVTFSKQHPNTHVTIADSFRQPYSPVPVSPGPVAAASAAASAAAASAAASATVASQHAAYSYGVNTQPITAAVAATAATLTNERTLQGHSQEQQQQQLQQQQKQQQQIPAPTLSPSSMYAYAPSGPTATTSPAVQKTKPTPLVGVSPDSMPDDVLRHNTSLFSVSGEEVRFVQLELSAKGLLNRDWVGISDPMCYVSAPRNVNAWNGGNLSPNELCSEMSFRTLAGPVVNPSNPNSSNARNDVSLSNGQLKPKEQWECFARTEALRNTLEPQWTKRIRVQYFFDQEQRLRFDIIDVDDFKTLRGDFLGMVETTLAQLLQKGTQTFPLVKKMGASSTQNLGTISIRVHDENEDGRVRLNLILGAKRLSNMKRMGGMSSPYFSLTMDNGNGTESALCRSEVADRNLNPQWAPQSIMIPTHDRTWDNVHLRLKVRDYYKNKPHKKMGAVSITLDQLIRSGQIKLQPEQVPNMYNRMVPSGGGGEIIVHEARAKPMPGFIQFLQGGLTLDFVVAVDFTSSNKPADKPESLHYNNDALSTNNSVYARALHAVGTVISVYTRDGMITALGFGGVPPNERLTNFNFPLSGKSDARVHGVAGLMEAYAYMCKNVKMSAPTNFEPLIRAVTASTRPVTQQDQHFTVLLIVTDGRISDFDKTVDAIIDASHDAPLSIVIVGVGEADFSSMKWLDCDDSMLASRDGSKMAKADIVQFTKYENDQSLSSLTAEVLDEIPTRLVDYMIDHDIRPNTPL